MGNKWATKEKKKKISEVESGFMIAYETEVVERVDVSVGPPWGQSYPTLIHGSSGISDVFHAIWGTSSVRILAI